MRCRCSLLLRLLLLFGGWCVLPQSNCFVLPPTFSSSSAAFWTRLTELYLTNSSSKTLYDVLGAAPTDSRSTLKQKYVELAKLSHPDAQNDSTDLDFTEIAAAYQILSDPKQRQRYDRSLKAEKLSENIAEFMSENASPVTDMGVELLERVAFPFLRRTTAATLASVSAAVQTKDLSKTLNNAVQAAVNAGKAVDKMELEEKSQWLEEQALENYNSSVALQEQLRQAATDRLQLTLHTQQSGLTSAEALLILDQFNQTKSASMWEKANSLMRCTVETEIATLQTFETDFVQVQKSDSMVQESFNTAVRNKLKAQNALQRAEVELEEARLRFEKAQADLKNCRLDMEKCNSESQNWEVAAQKSSFELERLSVLTTEQSETTRLALRKRESNIVKSLDPDYKIVPDPETEEENARRLETLNGLRQKEREMAQRAKYLENSAAKQLSRSNKLKRRVGARDRLEGQKNK